MLNGNHSSSLKLTRPVLPLVQRKHLSPTDKDGVGGRDGTEDCRQSLERDRRSSEDAHIRTERVSDGELIKGGNYAGVFTLAFSQTTHLTSPPQLLHHHCPRGRDKETEERQTERKRASEREKESM